MNVFLNTSLKEGTLYVYYNLSSLPFSAMYKTMYRFTHFRLINTFRFIRLKLRSMCEQEIPRMMELNAEQTIEPKEIFHKTLFLAFFLSCIRYDRLGFCFCLPYSYNFILYWIYCCEKWADRALEHTHTAQTKLCKCTIVVVFVAVVGNMKRMRRAYCDSWM